jgi:hypothetical protein
MTQVCGCLDIIYPAFMAYSFFCAGLGVVIGLSISRKAQT